MTTTDFTDPKQVDQRKKKINKARAAELSDLEAVIKTPAGLRVLSRVMDKCGLLAPNMFTGNSTTFYNLGKRDVGLWMYNEIMEANPGSFIAMMETKLKEIEDNG